MFIIGLTGGIGSGKSTAANILQEMGLKIIDLDQIAQKVTKPGESAYNKIAENFGAKYFDRNGNLNRKQLKQDIFLSDDIKKSVEFLLHPIIFDECKYQLDNLNKKEYVVLVVPLLFETKNYFKLITKSLLIDCDEELQIKRVIKRDDVTEAFAKKIISSQMSRKKKLQLADKVIENNGNVDYLKDQLEKFYTALVKEKISASI